MNQGDQVLHREAEWQHHRPPRDRRPKRQTQSVHLRSDIGARGVDDLKCLQAAVDDFVQKKVPMWKKATWGLGRRPFHNYQVV